ncbi:response regulator transcription factor [Streptomyces sp. NBC_01803]|uniref:response regulator transcription factor n=1 Tax=Streptomyces sp. NBC_01803 TaxID=2975946 RepID=UPI002DD82D6F|nr:response regulator transcription factor [Streptomyces sp. NBC_01803]WSA42956.1 response regulator transcription factor [Streptomyces sp. NBC_01803]
MIRVLVAEDHPIVLRGIVEAIERHRGMAVVRTCQEEHEVVAEAVTGMVQVAVIDIDLRGSDGARAARELVSMGAGIKAILISATADRELVESNLAAGCSGFLLKTDGDSDIPAAITRALGGRITISSGVRTILRPTPARGIRGVERPVGQPVLTQREHDVVRLVAEGKSTEAMADELHLTANTVRSYLQSAMRKLNVHSRVQVLLAAQRSGLL